MLRINKERYREWEKENKANTYHRKILLPERINVQVPKENVSLE
jgi:hypothetical protein